MTLFADRSALRSYARRRGRAALAATVIAGSIATAILVFDYRFMLIAIIVLVAPLIIGIDAWFARRCTKLEFVSVACEEGGVLVRTPDEEVRADYPSISARAQPDGLVVAIPLRPGRWQQWIVPGEAEAVTAFASELEAKGVVVARDRGSAGMVVALLLGVVLSKVLAVVAAGMVLGALANIVLAIAGKGGSYATGGLLLLGALACLTVTALLLRRGE